MVRISTEKEEESQSQRLFGAAVESLTYAGLQQEEAGSFVSWNPTVILRRSREGGGVGKVRT